MGGRAGVESIPGEGSVFGLNEEVMNEGQTILLVDDSENVSPSCARPLKGRHSGPLKDVRNGEEVIAYLRARPYRDRKNYSIAHSPAPGPEHAKAERFSMSWPGSAPSGAQTLAIVI